MTADIASIRSCKYLSLGSVGETGTSGLRIVLQEAVMSDAADDAAIASESSPELRELLASSRPIVHQAGCRVFELIWPSYIGYSVENESFALPEPAGSVGEGALLIIYSKSVYLDYLAKTTFANDDYPGPMQHYAIHCLDHIVNVAACSEPVIREWKAQ
jgi:hypothetical protein